MIALLLAATLISRVAPDTTPQELARLRNNVQAFEVKVAALDRHVSRALEQMAKQDKLLVSQRDSLTELRRALDQSRERLQNTDKTVTEVRINADDHIGRLNDEMNRQETSWTIGLSGVALLALVGIVFLRRGMTKSAHGLESAVAQHRKQVDEENVRLEAKLVEIMAKQVSSTAIPQTAKSDEVDHTLALRVGEEIHRMRTRIKNMPEETKGLKALENSLERLEDDFKGGGYEIINLLGNPYVEGMNIDGNVRLSEEMEPGKAVITKIVAPQINFRGVLIRMAKVEVTCGPELS